jgi:hypothetical protein
MLRWVRPSGGPQSLLHPAAAPGKPGSRHIVIFAYSLLAYGFQLVSAVMLALHPHESGIVDDLAFVISCAFAVALNRPGSCSKAPPSRGPIKSTRVTTSEETTNPRYCGRSALCDRQLREPHPRDRIASQRRASRTGIGAAWEPIGAIGVGSPIWPSAACVAASHVDAGGTGLSPDTRGSREGISDMSETQQTSPAVDRLQVTHSATPRRSGWTAWVIFAGVMMILLGMFQIVEGLTALFRHTY